MRSREFRRESRLERLRSYFYGKKPHSFFPFSFDIALSDVEVFKIGGTYTVIHSWLNLPDYNIIILLFFTAPAVPESALPIGMEKEDGSTQLIPIEPSEILIQFVPL